MSRSMIRTCRFFMCFTMNLCYAAPFWVRSWSVRRVQGQSRARRDKLRLTERQYPVDPSR